MTQIFGLKPNQILAAQQSGLSFAPLCKNKLRCNQFPELGLMSAKQADSLRSQIWLKTRKRK
jgi:hypothetical protein